MKIEDVKPGMWVQRESPFTEDAIVFQFGNQADNRRAWQAIYRDGSVGWCSHDTLHECEPWVPRVGEWVRRNEQAIHLGLAPDVGTRQVDAVRSRCAAFHGGVRDVSFDWLEPCAPPEAKPETGRRVDGGPVVVVHLAAGASVQELEETERSLAHFAGIDTSTWPQRTRDHNATCSRCGGRAYQGLKPCLPQCIEPACDDPKTRMPPYLREVPHHGADNCRPMERVWSALGRGVAVRHPTRDGAIQAWRDAVRGGATMGKP